MACSDAACATSVNTVSFVTSGDVCYAAGCYFIDTAQICNSAGSGIWLRPMHASVTPTTAVSADLGSTYFAADGTAKTAATTCIMKNPPPASSGGGSTGGGSTGGGSTGGDSTLILAAAVGSAASVSTCDAGCIVPLVIFVPILILLIYVAVLYFLYIKVESTPPPAFLKPSVDYLKRLITRLVEWSRRVPPAAGAAAPAVLVLKEAPVPIASSEPPVFTAVPVRS